MTELTGDRAKITAAHRARMAFVYVRQSSLQQVRHNRESQRRQYDFAAQTTTFGWRRDRVVISTTALSRNCDGSSLTMSATGRDMGAHRA